MEAIPSLNGSTLTSSSCFIDTPLFFDSCSTLIAVLKGLLLTSGVALSRYFEKSIFHRVSLSRPGVFATGGEFLLDEFLLSRLIC